MLYIPCPYCGHRDETEFTYGGPSHVTRPELAASDREWTHYLYHRENPKGPYREQWLHSFGCGQWFNVLRDTSTHEILEVYLMGESAATAGEVSHPSARTLSISEPVTANTTFMAIQTDSPGHTASTAPSSEMTPSEPGNGSGLTIEPTP